MKCIISMTLSKHAQNYNHSRSHSFFHCGPSISSSLALELVAGDKNLSRKSVRKGKLDFCTSSDSCKKVQVCDNEHKF